MIDLQEAMTTLATLAKLAKYATGSNYEFAPFALGFIPYKDGENLGAKIGYGFLPIVEWLVKESRKDMQK